eukprot:7005584-Prymnesium_polylepis.1
MHVYVSSQPLLPLLFKNTVCLGPSPAMELVPFETGAAAALVPHVACEGSTTEWSVDQEARVQQQLEVKLEKGEIANRAGAGSQQVSYVEAWRVIEKVRALDPAPSSCGAPALATTHNTREPPS